MDNKTFLEKVYSLIGLTYDECVCDAVIRNALEISFSGTNWLFRSINNSGKYRYLTKRVVCGGGEEPPPGAIVFKIDESKTPSGYSTGPDAYHCGVVDYDGFVIHSSPKTGVRKDTKSRWIEWDYWGLMKQVSYEDVCDRINSVNSNRGDSNVTVDSISYGIEDLSDRELLEEIYRAVVRD